MIVEALPKAEPNQAVRMARFTFKKEPLADFVQEVNDFLRGRRVTEVAFARAEEAGMVGSAKLMFSVAVSYCEADEGDAEPVQIEAFRDILPSRMEERINAFLREHRAYSVSFETIVKAVHGFQQQYDPVIAVIYGPVPPRGPGELRLKAWDNLSPPEMRLHGRTWIEEELPRFCESLRAEAKNFQIVGTEFRSYSYTPGFRPIPQDGAITLYRVW